MNDYESADIESTDLEPRTERSLTECMTVLPDAPDLFTVVGENGNESYRVDVRAGVCSCNDFTFREPEGGCKHLRRVAFATGERPIPASVEGVDPLLGAQTDDTPRRAASDGGVVETTKDTDESDDGDERPEDCDCGDWNQGLDLCCWPCYRENFREPAPVDEN